MTTNLLLHLINERNFAAGSLKVTYSALKFFYSTTCARDWDVLSKLRVPKQKTLPDVLSIAEVHQLIAATKQLHNATFFWTVYTLGLRLEEGLHLQVGDIDSKRMMIHIHRGKGAKDRFLPLPQSTLALLRNYWKRHRNQRLLFPANGRNRKSAAKAGQPMNASTLQGCIKRVAQSLNFNKSISPHTLRHSMATHLFEAGVSLRWIQKFLGHPGAPGQTTLVYLHLTDDARQDGRQKLDQIAEPGGLFDKFTR